MRQTYMKLTPYGNDTATLGEMLSDDKDYNRRILLETYWCDQCDEWHESPFLISAENVESFLNEYEIKTKIIKFIIHQLKNDILTTENSYDNFSREFQEILFGKDVFKILLDRLNDDRYQINFSSFFPKNWLDKIIAGEGLVTGLNLKNWVIGYIKNEVFHNCIDSVFPAIDRIGG